MHPYGWTVLLGREGERARIDRLLHGARNARSGVLVIHGEPGAGKSALLEDAGARAEGLTVLRARSASLP